MNLSWFYRIPNWMRLAAAVAVTLFLTYLLLSSDPWWLLRKIPTQAGRELHSKLPDWAYHFIAYAGFSFVLMWYGAARPGRVVMLLVAFASGHAVATEFLQRLVPDRTFDLNDLAANFAGIGAGTIAGLLLSRLYAPRAEPELNLSLQRSSLAPQSAATQDAPGFNRERVATEAEDIAPPRIINFRFVGIASVTGIVLLGSVYTIHGWQVRRNAGSLFDLSQQAKADGNVDKAREFMGRYVGLVPNDINAMADYGLLLDESSEPGGTSRQVFMVFEEVLRNDPTREDIRRRQVEIAMALGRIPDALAHVKVLRQSHPTDARLSYLAGCCLESLLDHEAAAEAWQSAIDHDSTRVDAYARLARVWHEHLDRPEGARRLLDTMIDNNAKSPAAWVARARFRQDFGSIVDAPADIEQALLLDPEDRDTLLAAADLAYARAKAAETHGQTTLVTRIASQSRKQLREASRRVPGDLELRLKLVMLEAHFGSEESALRTIDDILTLSPDDSRAKLMLVDVSLQKGEFEQARTAIEQLPRTPGSDALRKYLQGRLLMSQGKWAEAVVVLDEARRLTADTPGMLERTDLALARCQAALEDINSQLAAFRRVLKTNPLSVPARLGLAAALVKDGQTEAAIAEYRQLTDLPQIRLLLARVLIVRNQQLPELARDWREVEMLLAKADAENSFPAEVALVRAELYAARGQLERARRVIQNARASQSDRIEFWVALSNLCQKIGDERNALLWKSQALVAAGNDSLAEKELRRAVELPAPDQAAVLRLIEFLVRQSRQQEAIRLFKTQAEKLHPQEVGRAYALLGYWDYAKTTFERILKVRPNDLTSLQGLGQVHLRQRNLAAAIPLLQRILEPATSAPRSDVDWARQQLALALTGSSDPAAVQKAMNVLDVEDANRHAANVRARAAILASRPSARDRTKAIELLQELGDRNELLPKDHWLLARLYDVTGQTDQVAAHFEHSLNTQEPRAEFIRDYVLFLVRTEQLDPAERWCDHLEERQPNSELAIEARGMMLAARGRVDEFQTLLSNFAGDSRSNVDSSMKLMAAGAIAERIAAESRRRSSDRVSASTQGPQGNPASDQVARTVEQLNGIAERLYRDAVQQDPAQITVLIGFLARHNRRDEATRLIPELWQHLPEEKAAACSLSLLQSHDAVGEPGQQVETRLLAAMGSRPKSIVLKLCLADLRCLQDRVDEAERIYRLILQVDRDNVQASNNLAWLLAMNGQELDEAFVLIQRAIKLAGPVAQLRDTRGCVHLARGNLKKAVADFTSACDETHLASALFHRAVAESRQGLHAEARGSFAAAKASGFDPDSLTPVERQAFRKNLKRLLPSRIPGTRKDAPLQ